MFVNFTEVGGIYFQLPKVLGSQSSQTISACGRSHCGRKIIRWSRGRL